MKGRLFGGRGILMLRNRGTGRGTEEVSVTRCNGLELGAPGSPPQALHT